MNHKSISSLADVASKLQSDLEQSLIFERFLPATEMLQVCEKFGHCFRDRIYTPVITLWTFLGQDPLARPFVSIVAASTLHDFGGTCIPSKFMVDSN